MLKTVITIIASYFATNIDDMFLGMLFFSQARGTGERLAVVAGKFIGIGALMLLGMAGAAFLSLAPQGILRFLGLVPIALGVRVWFSKEEESDDAAPASRALALSVALVTIANGGDNIGVYVPLFAGFSAAEYALTVVIFAAMTALWCWLGRAMADYPRIHAFLSRYKRVIVPAVLIVLGVQILIG